MNLQQQHEQYARYLRVRDLRDLLSEAREYVAESLDAHEHSDGRELLAAIDSALAAAASGGDVKQAPGEAPQSGGDQPQRPSSIVEGN